MKRQRNTTQMKEHMRNTEVQINEEETDKQLDQPYEGRNQKEERIQL